MSWADGLLLLSTSVTGLQRCLDLLHAYGYKWGLHVNTLKTKAMVLTKQRYKTERFMYNGTLLECVKSFNYLGFEISHNGNFSNLINDRVLKAEMTSWKSCALPKGLVTAFENFKRNPPVIWRRFIQITWNGLSISISTPAIYVSMKSLRDSRLLIELGPW